MSEGPLVDRLQQNVADRQPIDWAALMSELHATNAAQPEMLREISLLKLLDEIANAHSQFQSGEYGDDQMPTAPVEEPPGDETLESWGRYELKQKVGRGGFGSVYRGVDRLLEMAVAIKILHRRYSDERLKDRLLSEGRALAQVHHPNVVRVLNVEEHDGRLGLVMEFLSGETMDGLAGRVKLDALEASAIVEDVCKALTAVHAVGLIHRDVKARNIIRQPDGRVVLMDFGAGLSVDAARDATAVGTPLYMAPETFKGAPATHASDVYSVGVLLFYLVTRRYPYEGNTVDDIHDAHGAGRANSLLQLRSDLPVRFVKVVERAIAVDPVDRYPTPQALLEALVRARVNTLTWPQRLYRLAAGVVIVGLLMLVGGMISSAAFNSKFDRGDYATESFGAWFALGRRSLLMPVVLSLVGALLVGAALALRNILVPMSAGLRTFDRRLRSRCVALADRLSLRDATVCGSWIVMLTAVGIGVVWTAFSPLLHTLSINWSTASGEALSVLGPANLEYRTHYRMSLGLLAAANVTAWYALRRATAGRAIGVPMWVVAMELAVMVLLYGSMQLPYRILNDHNRFKSTTWQGDRCFVLGKRPEDALLFCPEQTPRIRIRPASAGPLIETDAGTSMYDSFGPRPPQPPHAR